MRFNIFKLGFSVIVICCLNTSILGQEISTRGEIFNFEVGDVYHYTDYGSFGGGNYGHTKISIDSVLDKYYSTYNDTIYYLIHHQIKEISDEFPYWQYNTSIVTRSYSELDSLIFNGNIDTIYINPDEYNGRKINDVHYYSPLPDTSWYHIKWVEGCGRTLRTYDNQNGWNHSELTLEYYRKGQEEWGVQQIITDTKEISCGNLAIFPNPAKNEFYIDSKNCKIDIESIEIYSIHGELVKSQKLKNTTLNKIEIDKFKKGLYIIKLVSRYELSQFKFIKE